MEGRFAEYSGHVRYSGITPKFEVFSQNRARKRVAFGSDPLISMNFDGTVATLYNPVLTRQRNIGTSTTVLEFEPSLCVVGRRSWGENDRVYTLSARINGVDGVLGEVEQDQELSASDPDSALDTTTIQMESPRWRGRFFRSGQYNIFADRFVPNGHKFKIEFKDPAELDDVFQDLFEIRSFLVMCAGADVEVSEITIGASSTDEQIDSFDLPRVIGRSSEKGEFDVAMSARFDGRKAIESALNAWLNLESDWHAAKIGVFRYCIEERSNYGDRLLDACRWYEKLPTAIQRPLLSEDEKKSIVRRISESFPNLDASMQDRIRGALRWFHLEDRRETISRIVSTNPHLVKGNTKIDELVRLSVEGLRARGKYAHGPVGASNRGELKELVSYVDAIAFVCFGEMFKAIGAPTSENGLVAPHPMNYFLMSSRT